MEFSSKRSLLIKVLPTILVFFLLFNVVGNVNTAHAFFSSDCNVGSAGSGAPYPGDIICPLIRIVNLLILVAGVGLAVFIGYGAIKLSASTGDPKAYEASLRTFWFAIIGFFVVVGSFALLFILDTTLGLGLGFSTPGEMVDRIRTSFDELLCEKFWIIQGSNCQFEVPSN